MVEDNKLRKTRLVTLSDQEYKESQRRLFDEANFSVTATSGIANPPNPSDASQVHKLSNRDIKGSQTNTSLDKDFAKEKL